MIPRLFFKTLAEAGLLERNKQRRVRFPYDEIHVDFMLHGAAQV